jgi:hypothetical protein
VLLISRFPPDRLSQAASGGQHLDAQLAVGNPAKGGKEGEVEHGQAEEDGQCKPASQPKPEPATKHRLLGYPSGRSPRRGPCG